jgi:predicted nucleic acid-binding protein
VIDACALIAYLRGEIGGAVVRNLLETPGTVCYAHSVNLCEVYYLSVRQKDSNRARAIIATLYADGIIERRDMSRKFWREVGDLKAGGRISLPDCMCIALAVQLSATVVTSDHGEFDPLVPLGIVPIQFIR